MELFSPANLDQWVPEGEPDVYMVFGALASYTRYRYCCALSKRLAERLGLSLDTRPDAILVNNDTGEYVIAEFKMHSSSYRINHAADDVDVLVVWEHDETDLTKLPPEVVTLREIARDVAFTSLADE